MDCPDAVIYNFSNLFPKLGKDQRAPTGPVLFTTLPLLPRFLEYHMMIPVIDVLLRPQLDPITGAYEGEGSVLSGAICSLLNVLELNV